MRSVLLIMLLNKKEYGEEDAHYPFIDAGPTGNLRGWKMQSAIKTAVPSVATWGWLQMRVTPRRPPRVKYPTLDFIFGLCSLFPQS